MLTSDCKRNALLKRGSEYGSEENENAFLLLQRWKWELIGPKLSLLGLDR